MLRIGFNHYELVRVHSGFSVTLTNKSDDAIKREQVWDLEAHYVPSEFRHTPREDGRPEYLRLSLRSEDYHVADWRELSGFGLDTEDDSWFCWAKLENLIAGFPYKAENWRVIPGWLEVKRAGDCLFHCEFFGCRKLADGTEEELEFKDELPFREVTAYVPINAADPLAKAKEMAARMLQLTDIAQSRVQAYDPAKNSYLSLRINSHHCVTLQTPWRQEHA